MAGLKSKFRYSKLDAVQNAFFERQLTVVNTNLFKDSERELITRSLLPKIDGVDSAAGSYLWRTWSKVGIAKIIASYADDLPRSDVSGDETFAIIKSLGASYGYNVMEIRQAERANVNLPQAKADAAARAIDEKTDAILAKGDASHNLQGFINLPNTILYTVPNGVSGHADWPEKTGLEVLADLIGMQINAVTVTRNAEKPDTLVLPLTKFSYISQTPFNQFTNSTILDTFLKVSPYVKTVVPWLELSGAGTSGTDRAICYRRSSDVVGALIPQEMETFPPEPRGLEFVVPCHSRVGGVVLFRPLAVTYADGI